jgi:hypothetical protein
LVQDREFIRVELDATGSALVAPRRSSDRNR